MLHFCLCNTKKFCLYLVGTSIRFKSLKMNLKWERQEAWTRKRSGAIFSKVLKHLSLIILLCFLCCSFTSDSEKQIVTFQLCIQWHKNSSICWRNEENIGKCLIIDTCLMMGDSTLVRRQRRQRRQRKITLLKKTKKKKTNYIYFTQFLSEFFSKIHQNANNNNKLMPGPRTIRAKMVPAQ